MDQGLRGGHGEEARDHTLGEDLAGGRHSSTWVWDLGVWGLGFRV